MILVDVYSCRLFSLRRLYLLLSERERHESISHKKIPTWLEHTHFVLSKPYLHWYLIEEGGICLGAIYLSKQREIGIGIFKAHRGQGHATRAINLLMGNHPGKFLANVNPGNLKSAELFGKLGFRHIQNTYEI